MTIANREQFWQLRTNGTDPTDALGSEHKPWVATGSGASASNDAWVVTDQRLAYTPTTDAYTLFACFNYGVTDPDNGEVLMKLDNGTHKVEVQATGNIQTLKLVGATTVQTEYLDISMLDDDATPLILRLTLDSSGNARLYMREIIEDDDAETHYLSVTGATGSSKTIEWGNNSGTVHWQNVFASYDGAFSPDELSHNEFVQDSLFRSGFKVIDLLQKSKRTYLKSMIHNSAIIYGYDLSNKQLSRISSPSIHVVIKNLESQDMTALGGHRLDTRYDIECFIVTHGTDYKNAYRRCLDITGDVFDEIMTNYGLDFNHDSIIGYRLKLNSKIDDDDNVCAHVLTFNAIRRMHLQRR